MKTICLKTPTMAGKIHVGTDAIDARLPALLSGQKNFVVTDSNVYALYKAWFARYFADVEIFVLTAGEEHKTFQSLYAILEKMAAVGLHRNSRLFAVGGGVVGDIGGLAAALYMRGISCVQIPTTLLAQVDSSVGGKTAVDLGGVKNIVGAFLQTLPARELKCGVGEIVKYAALSGEIFDVLENDTDRLNDLAFLSDLIVTCIQHKADVVQADEKENAFCCALLFLCHRLSRYISASLYLRWRCTSASVISPSKRERLLLSIRSAILTSRPSGFAPARRTKAT